MGSWLWSLQNVDRATCRFYTAKAGAAFVTSRLCLQCTVQQTRSGTGPHGWRRQMLQRTSSQKKARDIGTDRAPLAIGSRYPRGAARHACGGKGARDDRTATCEPDA